MDHIDFGRHSDDYATHRPGFPGSFYERLDVVVPCAGRQVLDLATGPGTVALELAARGSTVVGIDVAPAQIEAARRGAELRGLGGSTRFHVARAEETGEADASFELVTAGQCWHWFDSEATLREVHRVLRAGGHLVLAYYSYLARHSLVARETEELVLEFNPDWTMAGWTGIFPERIDELIQSGFSLVEQFCYDHAEAFTHAAWRGRMRTCNGVGSGNLAPDQVRAFDDALAAHLAGRYPDPVDVEHRVWCVVVRKKS